MTDPTPRREPQSGGHRATSSGWKARNGEKRCARGDAGRHDLPRLLAMAGAPGIARRGQPMWAAPIGARRFPSTPRRSGGLGTVCQRPRAQELMAQAVGIAYRVEVPGGIIDAGVLRANVSLPGLAISDARAAQIGCPTSHGESTDDGLYRSAGQDRPGGAPGARFPWLRDATADRSASCAVATAPSLALGSDAGGSGSEMQHDHCGPRRTADRLLCSLYARSYRISNADFSIPTILIEYRASSRSRPFSSGIKWHLFGPRAALRCVQFPVSRSRRVLPHAAACISSPFHGR